MPPGNLLLGLRPKVGVGDAQVMVSAHSGIEVAQQNKLFIVGDAADDGCEVFRRTCLLYVADIVGAYTLTRVTGPAVVLSRRVRSRSVPLLPGSIMLSRLFLTAKPTPYSLCSPDPFPCQ